jgi:regulatory protein
MKITAIKPQQKNKQRYNIYDEDGFIGALNMETVVKNSLCEDIEISQEDFDKILVFDNERYAFDKALHYLSFCARSQQEIERYLKSKDLAAPVIESAVQKLKNYGYIDDTAYAKQLAHTLVSGKKLGRQAAEFRLKQKGISKEIIEEVLCGLSDETEEQNARQIFENLSLKYKNDDKNKRRMKIIRNMAAKGYDFDTIHSLFNEGEE